MSEPTQNFSRRGALRLLGMAAGAVVAARMAPASATTVSLRPGGAQTLRALMSKLDAAPRRRSFKSVPFLVDSSDFWDHEAAMEIISYRGHPTQVWENSEIAAAWPNLMRESLNGQVFAHRNLDFLAVSATHGSAHLALFNQAMWDKYALASRTGGVFKNNSLIVEKAGIAPSDDREDVDGFYGFKNSNITTLQRRGVVFIACHDSIHAIARGLVNGNSENADAIAADLSNNLIPGAVLVPSVVAFLPQLQRAGFTYAKGA
ncbi:hypothetical protein [Rhodanobacter sp. C05]|jgi:intracellular sulfur oxidation DsrE/DsrF family protein|uniref:thiosulfate dehydrogenase n=1 Tax=Rhodanobacter sp. C05 TaxID=1945855 RepID=UPI0009858082|nr:hypothetical protein [Rhodanobacter sp. C05]OOG41413.1 hypothetical protein B0E51_06850 [Rhodanobacter sp. C05]